MKKKIIELTRAEEEVMLLLWQRERAFVKDLLEDFADPKPAYNTVSTILRILEEKGIVSHNAYGRAHEYFPIVSREDYKSGRMKELVRNYFGNSLQEMVSFFTRKEKLSVKEIDELMELLKAEKKKK